MKHNALIVLEALLLGQRVKLPTGHTVTMEDGKLALVAEIWSTAGDEKEILLAPHALGEMDTFVEQCSKMSAEDVFLIGAQNASIKMGKERGERRLQKRREFEAEYTGSFPLPEPCPACGGTAQGRTVNSCPACKGTGVAR